ncbi:MAG TPA: flagellar basal body-associated FliL family protein [Candidatus Eisenbacteria bacterium]|nr:flagellar basal body-associated FliL family protein [Candidatus Eisenbacteria bacterium]
MADEDKAQDTAPAKQRGGIMHAIALGCALALALGGIGAAAWRLGLANVGQRADAAIDPARGGARRMAGDGALEPMDPFIANLSDDDGHRYLKATIQVEFYDSIVPPEFHGRLPQARDMLLTLFSSKNFAEVRTPQGKAVLREEIVNRLNTVLNQDAVKAVYFTEFIVQ